MIENILFLLCVLCIASATWAQDTPEFSWQAYDIHPPGAGRTIATGISEVGISGNQAWSNYNFELSGGTLWYWPEDAHFYVYTPNNSGSFDGADRNYQIGSYTSEIDGTIHTALFFASLDENLIDMQPQGVIGAALNDIQNNVEAGIIYVYNRSHRLVTHAAVWPNASAESMIDIHPVWSTDAGASQCEATDGKWFAGRASSFERNRMVATLWKGTTPQSAINMDPPDSDFRGSGIAGMAPGVQVGSAITAAGKTHAFLWHNTPESIIDMHPSFHPNKHSFMYGTLGWIHIGRSAGGAGYWLGDDPDSFVSLHDMLPGGGVDYITSYPWDIDVIDNKLIIAGEGVYIDQLSHAIVWIGTPINATAKHFLRQTEGSKVSP